MDHIIGIESLRAEHAPSVVSIGNYDGVHCGHQSVIRTLVTKAEELQAAATVVTFDPLAREYFSPGSIARLSTRDERAALLFAQGVARVVCIPFDKVFASMSAEAFIDEVLVAGLGARYVCVGDDFRFGRQRVGDFALLHAQGQIHGFEVTAHETFELAGARVSSGRIRDALAAGNFSLAEQLLGRPYTVEGVVSQGQQLGRTLDFPTANLVLPDMLMPVNGVFAVIAQLGQSAFPGVANVGRRPTVNGKENRLEVHLFDFNQDIYGAQMKVRFIQKLREEKSFASVDALRTQIQQDALSARRIFDVPATE
ncbi:riboflavin biosynthesis protein [Arenicella chitinivorans]|uniref:Riboflavin biosynthesis protein n=1 Tax=Arenicella chitinivorans TaxID=1329800 RepID=A0A918VLK2_9GAMM|nr:bifunctional riboflavin kinase/FAD synthetase [Arenicella chitinivorans]GHA07216.1 riboflavin biosynthesis protein [Arenicella chitinivorans]